MLIKEKGLYITKEELVFASGISKIIINDDIKNGTLRANSNDEVWYYDALKYIHEKWINGKTQMHSPYGNEPNSGFAARLLGVLDDEMVVGRITLRRDDKK